MSWDSLVTVSDKTAELVKQAFQYIKGNLKNIIKAVLMITQLHTVDNLLDSYSTTRLISFKMHLIT